MDGPRTIVSSPIGPRGSSEIMAQPHVVHALDGLRQFLRNWPRGMERTLDEIFDRGMTWKLADKD